MCLCSSYTQYIVPDISDFVNLFVAKLRKYYQNGLLNTVALLLAANAIATAIAHESAASSFFAAFPVTVNENKLVMNC